MTIICPHKLSYNLLSKANGFLQSLYITEFATRKLCCSQVPPSKVGYKYSVSVKERNEALARIYCTPLGSQFSPGFKHSPKPNIAPFQYFFIPRIVEILMMFESFKLMIG